MSTVTLVRATPKRNTLSCFRSRPLSSSHLPVPSGETIRNPRITCFAPLAIRRLADTSIVDRSVREYAMELLAPVLARLALRFLFLFRLRLLRRQRRIHIASSGSTTSTAALSATRQTNVFSFVERFTFKRCATETDLTNPPLKLPLEIQYYASVIMRNACRKDESRGGIRQTPVCEQYVYSLPFSFMLTPTCGLFAGALWELGIVPWQIRKKQMVQKS
jgi:hypothetical protein